MLREWWLVPDLLKPYKNAPAEWIPKILSSASGQQVELDAVELAARTEANVERDCVVAAFPQLQAPTVSGSGCTLEADLGEYRRGEVDQ